jgi:hypothetical protein
MYKSELDKAYKAGYGNGCLNGYRQCEDKTTDIIAICRRDAARGARLEMLAEMLEREDKAYADGLRDAGLMEHYASPVDRSE